MKFAEVENLEIINCDYEKLREKREATIKENNKLAAYNKKMKRSQITMFVIFVLLLVAITTLVMYFTWEIMFPNISQNDFVKKYNLDPIWVEVSIEIGIIIAFLFIARVIYGSTMAKIEKNKKVKKTISDSILFAAVAEDRTIGNFNISKYEDIPYVGQSVMISFDALNKSETKCYSFASVEHWKICLLPFLYEKTIIDVGNMTIYKNYAQDGQASSIEEYFVGKMLQSNTEKDSVNQQLTQKEIENQEIAQQLKMAESTNKILLEKVRTSEIKLEEANATILAMKQSMSDNSVLIVEERQKANALQAESDEQIKNLAEALKQEKQTVMSLNDKIKENTEVISQKDSEIKTLHEEIVTLQTSLEKEKVSYEHQKDEDAKVLAAAQQQLNAKYEKMHKSLTEEIEAHKADKVKMQEQFEATTEKRVQAAVEVTNKENEALRADNAELRNKVNKTAEDCEKRIAEAEAKNKSFAQESASAKNTAEQLKKQNEVLREKCTSLQRAYDDATNIAKSANEKCAEANQKLAEVNQRLSAEDSKKYQDLQQELDAARRDKEALQKKLDDETSRRERVTGDLTAAQKKINTQQDTISFLEDKLKKANDELRNNEDKLLAAVKAARQRQKEVEESENQHKKSTQNQNLERVLQERDEKNRRAREDAMRSAMAGSNEKNKK